MNATKVLSDPNGNLNRRHFVAATARLCGVGLGFGLSHPFVRAIEPFNRTSHRFKFSLAAYSYRKLLTGETPQLTLFDFVDDCARFGLDGTELTSYYFTDAPEPTFLAKLKAHCFRQGLDISGTAIRNDFGFEEGEKRQMEIAHTKRWIDYAHQLGAPVIRIFAGHQKPGESVEKTHGLIVSAIEECCEYAGKFGIYLALENHGGPTATADGLLKFVHDVKSEWFGVNLDTGNFASDDVYGDLAKIAPYALNAQVKVVFKNTRNEKQQADFTKLSKLLSNANYRGYVVLEYEEDEEPRSASQRYCETLKQAFLNVH